MPGDEVGLRPRALAGGTAGNLCAPFPIVHKSHRLAAISISSDLTLAVIRWIQFIADNVGFPVLG